MSVNRRDLLRQGGMAAAAAGLTAIDAGEAEAQAIKWDREADIVVVGSGGSGTVAAIRAKEAGKSVIVIEAQPHVGGHAICSGGNVALGGGTSQQKKYGVVDSPDLVFRDLTDWSVTQPNGAPDYRYNDREVLRAFADNCAQTFEFLVAHGVIFVDKRPDTQGGISVGNSAPREHHAAAMDWPLIQTGAPAPAISRTQMSTGNGLMQPLAVASQKAGVVTLTEHRMTALHKIGGRVQGIAVDNKGKKLNVRARKGVILASGGSSGNVNFRVMCDPRLTEEYDGIAGMPWSEQDGSGEMAAMAIGASLGSLANQTHEFGYRLVKSSRIGCRYSYTTLEWKPGSIVFDKAGATGLRILDWQNAITVNMLGKRFYDETGQQFTYNTYNQINPYTQGSYLNAKNVKWNPNNFINAALQGFNDGKNGGGPIWAIFDADAAAREKWTVEYPDVDYKNGFCFKADTIGELAQKIKMQYQRLPMPPENLEATVARYNSFVDSGKDDDFGKPKPLYKIAKAPFYAAWATPVIHDCRAGLRINGNCQVIDLHGQIISGLYACGETAGGFSQHGLARATCQGYIAGGHAAAQA